MIKKISIIVTILVLALIMMFGNTKSMVENSDKDEDNFIETSATDEIENMMSNMTLEQKISQMLVIKYANDIVDDNNTVEDQTNIIEDNNEENTDTNQTSDIQVSE